MLHLYRTCGERSAFQGDVIIVASFAALCADDIVYPPAQRSKKRKKNSSKGDAKTKGNEKKEKRTALSSASEEPLTLLPELVAELKLYIRRGGMEEARVAADRLANHHSASEDARERLLALRVVVILFRRSKRFRQALLELFPVFLDRTIGHKGESPLPPPRWASRALRAECIVAVKRWMADFGDFYPNLRVGYTYLKDKVGVRFVDIVAEQRMSARAARAIRDARNTLKASLDAIEQMRLHLDENNMSSAASGMIATMRTFWAAATRWEWDIPRVRGQGKTWRGKMMERRYRRFLRRCRFGYW